ncbi:MAG: hypothetical protein DRI36_02285 [Caldiserica bacterium]|nr:MAG: hypothetical protein DRI36_02285 [Caldisericota bacterium]
MRRRFLVKPELQLKYVIFTALLILITGVLTYFIMTHKLMTSPFTENLSLGEVTALKDEITKSFLWILFIILVGFTIQSIFLFHRLVGPIYALERVIEVMKQGKLGGRIKLRRHDQLKELASLIEEMGNRFASWIDEDRRKIGEIKKRIESLRGRVDDGLINEINEKLDSILKNFEIQSGN